MAQNSEKQPRRKAGGRPFRAGRSGNPGGRPKSLSAMVRELTGDGLSQVRVLMRIADGRLSVKAGDAKIPPSIRERIEAIRELFDRGWGTPIQTVAAEVTGKDGAPLGYDLTRLSNDDLRSFIAIARRAAPPGGGGGGTGST